MQYMDIIKDTPISAWSRYDNDYCMKTSEIIPDNLRITKLEELMNRAWKKIIKLQNKVKTLKTKVRSLEVELLENEGIHH